MSFPPELGSFAIAALAVALAFVIFGISAFGAAMLTVPVLSQLYPLEFVLPTTVLLDVTAALAIGTRLSRQADRSELKWMAPAALIGAVLGVTLLVQLPRRATIIAFGLFLLCYGAYSLRRNASVTRVSRAWAPVAGFVGGTMGTLFGIGAPPYAIYLTRRIVDKAALRTTLSTMVALSTSIRVIVFIATGLMAVDCLIMFGLLLPFALLGLWYGNRLQRRISREQLMRFISAVLMVMGASMLVRVLLQ